MQKDPNIQYVEGIIEAYHNAIKKVKLYGPTFFGPIIKEMNNFIKKEDDYSKYYILMILTDGIIDDLDNFWYYHTDEQKNKLKEEVKQKANISDDTLDSTNIIIAKYINKNINPAKNK